MAITAKVYCANKMTFTADGSGQAKVVFYPNYASGRNQSWATATPSLTFEMTVRDGSLFTVGQAYTVTFEADESADAAA